MTTPASLDALRARIRAMEGMSAAPVETVALAPEIDAALPWGGLPLACLHQVAAEDGDAAATAFCARLLARLQERGGTVLWCARGDDLHAPGLAGLGLDTARLLIARCRDDREVLWAVEEALRCPDLAGVVGEVARLDLTAGRRLQLAAEAGGVTALILHPPFARAAGAGTTRWRVAARPGGRWRIGLERCRGGLPGAWEMMPL